MPLTSAESSSGRMAPQLLKPHQAIAVLLKIKSRCLAGKRRRGGGERSKDGEEMAPAELFFLLCISCILKRKAHRHTHSLSLIWTQWAPLPESVERERVRERKNLIFLIFLNPDKRNRATQVLDRGPEPQEKI